MKSFLKTTFILFCLAGWALAALTLHVVRTPDGIIGIIPKNRLGIADTYVDVRGWTPKDLVGHEDLVKRVIEADKTHWLKHLFAEDGNSTKVQLADFLASGNPSTSQPARSSSTQASHSKRPSTTRGH